MERKALYNALRISSRQNPSQQVPSWQIADYRSFTIDKLFSELSSCGLKVDKTLFLALAEELDSPEELAEHLYPEGADEKLQDRIYLSVFELWRRLLPEKQTLSLLCDELDYRIEAFDLSEEGELEGLEDVLESLKLILDENLDAGGKPKELFSAVVQGCAHDLEGFLYDFIELEIKNGNALYAEELLESFSPYVIETHWFRFLEARLLAEKNVAEAHALLHHLVEEGAKKRDLEFCFALLFYAGETGEEALFFQLLKETVPLLEKEGDFVDLLHAAEDFAGIKDAEELEREIERILNARSARSEAMRFNPASDPDLISFLKKLKASVRS